jgi:hypothetical protein
MIPDVGSFCRFLPEKKPFNEKNHLKKTHLARVTCIINLLKTYKNNPLHIHPH